jgi:6-pyruvoyltetrahydropterin/6-carboxytetrahydropterin synthase
MDTLSVCKRVTFEASHFLPDYPGPCGNMHGHRFELEVEVYMDSSSKRNMVIDFKHLKSIIQETIIDVVDHSVLNDVYPEIYPTAENLIRHFVNLLKGKFFGFNCALKRIKLYETENSFAEWRKE